MVKTKWAHLPNAAHIDRILSSLDKHSDQWIAAQYVERYVERYVVLHEARHAARYVVQAAARYTEWDAAWYAAIRGAAGGEELDKARRAILALIAWDDCAYMLDLPEDKLSELREAGNQQALLLSAAASVLKEPK